MTTYRGLRTLDADSTFAIAWRTCFYNSFVGKQTLVFQISICGEKPRHPKSAKRWQQC